MEIAQFMLELASPSASPTTRFPFQANSHQIPNQQHNQNQQQQQQHQIPVAFSSTDNDYSFSPQPKKGRRASTATRRVVASPSGLPCPNCGKDSSTLWRTCELNNGSHYLCNACGLRYKKGKFCPLCYSVYYDADTNQLLWQQCQNCLNWTHKVCLQQQPHLVSPAGVYICPTCLRDPRPTVTTDRHARAMSM